MGVILLNVVRGTKEDYESFLALNVMEWSPEEAYFDGELNCWVVLNKGVYVPWRPFENLEDAILLIKKLDRLDWRLEIYSGLVSRVKIFFKKRKHCVVSVAAISLPEAICNAVLKFYGIDRY